MKLALPKTTTGISIPSSGLIVRREGTLVAKVEGDHVKLVTIEILRDQGKELDIVGGALAPGDRIVQNPSDELADGTKIDVVEGSP